MRFMTGANNDDTGNDCNSIQLIFGWGSPDEVLLYRWIMNFRTHSKSTFNARWIVNLIADVWQQKCHYEMIRVTVIPLVILRDKGTMSNGHFLNRSSPWKVHCALLTSPSPLYELKGCQKRLSPDHRIDFDDNNNNNKKDLPSSLNRKKRLKREKSEQFPLHLESIYESS